MRVARGGLSRGAYARSPAACLRACWSTRCRVSDGRSHEILDSRTPSRYLEWRGGRAAQPLALQSIGAADATVRGDDTDAVSARAFSQKRTAELQVRMRRK